MKIARWPDGTECPLEDFNYERDYAWMSDDYELVEVPDDYFEKGDDA